MAPNDKFVHKMSEMGWVSSCPMCRHRLTSETCVAFPGGIPHEIRKGEHKHTTPYPGDNGTQFEPWPTRK